MGSLLLYITVPIHRDGGLHWVENQAINGLRLWARHFERLYVVAPEFSNPPPDGFRPWSEVEFDVSNIELVGIPPVYDPVRWVTWAPRAYRRLVPYLEASDYRAFAIGGLWNDMGAFLGLECHRRGLPYAVWTDRVEWKVQAENANSAPVHRRLKRKMDAQLMRGLEKQVIRRASLGMFHGRSTFDAYRDLCARPELVHDIHLDREDHISPQRLQQKAERALAPNEPLHILYCGRAHQEKGPYDWIETTRALRERQVPFQATWLGDGPELDEMRALIGGFGLEDQVFAPGATSDRNALLERLRDADIFLFCHKTPESPRNLIEALISGCPIVGYESPYAQDLIAEHQGGMLSPVHDVATLVDHVAELHRDREQLSRKIHAAARDGAPFDDESVFTHRAELIFKYLS